VQKTLHVLVAIFDYDIFELKWRSGLSTIFFKKAFLLKQSNNDLLSNMVNQKDTHSFYSKDWNFFIQKTSELEEQKIWFWKVEEAKKVMPLDMKLSWLFVTD